MFAQQMMARQQLEQMRQGQLPPGMGPGGMPGGMGGPGGRPDPRPGTYL
jgi:hypothetical protein